MTPGQLIDLLAEAGMLKEESQGVFVWHPTMEKVERFVALLAEKRKPLTNEEIDQLMPYCHNEFDVTEFRDFARAIESKLKQKNGYAEENI